MPSPLKCGDSISDHLCSITVRLTVLMMWCRILFGNMAVIGFLSMWLANIATCAMMIPIAAAVLDELNAHRLQQREEERQKRCLLNSLAVFG